jgi:hypothetical protein
LKRTIKDGIGHGYQYLQQRLDELCDEVRGDRDNLAALTYVDADTAIRTNQVAQWQWRVPVAESTRI